MSHASDALSAPVSPARRRSALAIYVGRIRDFDRTDWLVYLGWVGMMLGLVVATGGFLLTGHRAGVRFPVEAWLIPIGAGIFTLAIAVDTIGHRTVYKEILKGGEAMVHHITMFCGVTSVLALVMAYHHPGFFIPGLVLTILSFVYSLVDEGFHWRRYVSQQSDPVEMWSHLGILIGHGTMMGAWLAYYDAGYPGVTATLAAMGVG